ncbi:MAG: Verru_Chthon cassette protein A [Verrucomicrobiota bacterium]
MEPRTSQLTGRKLLPSTSRSGVALVIVLGFLVLITVVIVAFLTSVSTEHSTASSAAAGATGREMADASVQLVMGQIREATSLGSNVAWASQPGMIRTYGSGGAGSYTASSSPLAYYKLYSSDNMIVDSASVSSFNPASDAPKGWDGQPAVFTDLNAPVTSSSNITSYPIMDPAAADIPSGKSDPMVEGFSINATTTPTATASTTNPIPNRAPMPVKWIYVLRDGTQTAPSGGNGTIADFSNAPAGKKPTADNPIVGRIAFWTDDETCKLNLNTACGGNPWDPPMFTTTMDMQFSRYGPAKNEFTRYPGHPATTSLLPVFWSFSGLTQPQVSLFPKMTLNLNTSKTSEVTDWQVVCDYTGRTAEQSFQTQSLLLSPRNMLGGSNLGLSATAGYLVTNVPLNLMDSDRLYASVDEAIFGIPGSPPAETSRPANAFTPAMTAADVNKLRFFLTASSRAPEVNMFNLPKVTMWPEPDTQKMVANSYSLGGSNTRSAVDQLIAFCSTLNTNAYYFTRYDATSSTNDFASGSRNLILYDYINGLFKKSIPGFGGTLDGQAGRNGSQILTLAVDYIRSDINLLDPSGGDSFSDQLKTRFKYAYTTPPKDATANYAMREIGTGQVVPTLMPNGTKGIGRFPTVQSANLMFIARRANQPPVEVDSAMKPTSSLTINPMHPWRGAPATTATINATTIAVVAANQYSQHPGMPYFGDALTAASGPFKPNPTYLPATPVLAPYETQMEVIFFIDPVNVGVGQVGLSCNYRIEVDGLRNFQIRDRAGVYQSLFPNVPDGTSEVAQFDNNPKSSPSDWDIRFGGDTTYDIGKEMHTVLRWSGGAGQSKLNFWTGGATSNLIVGPNSSGGGAANTYGQAFDFKGGNVTIRIYPPAGTTPVQTLTINFPDSTNGFPTPRLIGIKPVIQGPPNYYVAPGLDASGTNILAELLSFDSASASDLGKSRLGYDSSRNNSGEPCYHFTIPESGSDNYGRYKFTVDTVRSVECKYGDTRLVAALANVPASFFTPHKFYFYNLGSYTQTTGFWSQPWARSAHTLRRSGADRYSQAYNGATTGATLQPLADFLNIGNTTLSYYGEWGLPGGGDPVTKTIASSFVFGQYKNNWPHTTSSVDFTDSGFLAIWNTGGDFDNGPADAVDGPYINKPSEGKTSVSNPYYNWYNPDFQLGATPPTAGFFSPNRQIPSSAMFGSLPRGINPADPSATLNSAWQTLLFCPNPNSKDAATSASHAGMDQVSLGGAPPLSGKAPDYLLLDFFHMPVVEPYAISEPFSTAGKVNMNFQIAPFTYINRDTALRGVLASTLLTAVPDKWIKLYKNRYFYQLAGFSALDLEATSNGSWYFRYPIHAGETLKQFQNRFDQGDIFRSASEICSMFLYPAKQPATPTDVKTALVTDLAGSTANIKGWWYDGKGGERKSLTGDNMRERPYALLYPLLTTKSNSYTVHFRAQVLKKIPGTDVAQWVENKDVVASEFRGSSLIERYIDPSDPDLPDFAASGYLNSNPDSSLDHFPDPKNPGAFKSAYKFRVVSTKKFTAE